MTMENMEQKRIAVIGMGAAGSMAAYFAAKNGAQVDLYEKNEKLGKKIYITGKGRCNVTNAAPFPAFMEGISHNPKFLFSAFSFFSNRDLMSFFEKYGQRLKVERGQRVYPVTDHSSDINRALERALDEMGVQKIKNTKVTAMEISLSDAQRRFRIQHQKWNAKRGLPLGKIEESFYSAVILATGGKSYPSTGSTGDGLLFAKLMGHHPTACYPSLVAMELHDPWCKQLEGLSLRNVSMTIKRGKKKAEQFGDALFTAKGISGPIVLTLSSDFCDQDLSDATMELDWKPALSEDELITRLLREREKAPNRQIRTLLEAFLLRRAVPVFLDVGKLKSDQALHQWKKEEEMRFIDLLKHFPLHFRAFGSFREAVITRGGIPVQEVNPKTMESRLQPGLYFCGEVMDVDGYTGGYNLQIAFSTGAVAGYHAALSIKGGQE